MSMNILCNLLSKYMCWVLEQCQPYPGSCRTKAAQWEGVTWEVPLTSSLFGTITKRIFLLLTKSENFFIGFIS